MQKKREGVRGKSRTCTTHLLRLRQTLIFSEDDLLALLELLLLALARVRLLLGLALRELLRLLLFLLDPVRALLRLLQRGLCRLVVRSAGVLADLERAVGVGIEGEREGLVRCLRGALAGLV